MFIELGQRDRLAIGLGADLHDVAREFADHVAARYPGRQHQQLAVGGRCGDRQRDLEQVDAQIFGDDGVGDGWILVVRFFHVASRGVQDCRSVGVSMSRSTPGSSTLTSSTGCSCRMARAPWSPSSASSSGKWKWLNATGLPRSPRYSGAAMRAPSSMARDKSRMVLVWIKGMSPSATSQPSAPLVPSMACVSEAAMPVSASAQTRTSHPSAPNFAATL